MIYSSKNKIIITILSVVSIVIFFLFTILNIVAVSEHSDRYLDDYIYSFSNPLYALCWILSISLVILFILTIKGLIKGYRFKTAQRKLFYYVSLLILLIYFILYYPNYLVFRSISLWMIINFLGASYFIFFLIHIFKSNE